MKKYLGLTWLLVILISLAGCQQKLKNSDVTSDIILEDTNLHLAVNKCIHSNRCKTNQWSFDADAVATIYEDECKTLIAQHHLFNCIEGKTDITIDSLRSGGKVCESLSANDKLNLDGILCPSNSEACAAARLKLYGIALSSMNCLLDNKNLDIKYINKEDKGGVCCHVVEASGNILACCRNNRLFSNNSPSDKVRIWIDDNTGHIHRIWIGYLKNPKTKEYGYITANISNYLLQKNGMKLPTSIEYIPSDSSAGDSGKTILKIDMERFRFKDDIVTKSAI